MTKQQKLIRIAIFLYLMPVVAIESIHSLWVCSRELSKENVFIKNLLHEHKYYWENTQHE